MKHTDALTGEEFEGKAVILNTTEGPEFVAPATLGGGSGDTGLADTVAALVARVEELEDQVRELTADATAPAAEAKPATTRKAAAK